MRRCHKAHKGCNGVRDIAKAACLLAVSEERYIFSSQGLHNKARDYPSVVGMHSGTVRIKNTPDFDVHVVRSGIVAT